MFDYQVSKQNHFEIACIAFSAKHKGDLVRIAENIGMRPQMLRNKLNPEQPHMLTCLELLKLTDETEDASILDGLLEQLQCQPSVPVNELKGGNISTYLLKATAEVGSLAGAAVSDSRINAASANEMKSRVNTAIRCLTLIGVTISARLHGTPTFVSAVDAFTTMM